MNLLPVDKFNSYYEDLHLRWKTCVQFFSQDAHLARSCGARETEGEMVHVNKGNPVRVAWFIPMDGNTLQMIQYLVPFNKFYTVMNSPLRATCNSASSQRHFSQQETMPNQRDIFFVACLEPRRKGSCIHFVTLSKYLKELSKMPIIHFIHSHLYKKNDPCSS